MKNARRFAPGTLVGISSANNQGGQLTWPDSGKRTRATMYISMRISEEERKHLEEILGKSRTSVSRFMRDAMMHFTALHEQGGREQQAA